MSLHKCAHVQEPAVAFFSSHLYPSWKWEPMIRLDSKIVSSTKREREDTARLGGEWHFTFFFLPLDLFLALLRLWPGVFARLGLRLEIQLAFSNLKLEHQTICRKWLKNDNIFIVHFLTLYGWCFQLNLIRKIQIKWVISSNLFGLLRKPELHGSVYV